jgi:hypothetical protein
VGRLSRAVPHGSGEPSYEIGVVQFAQSGTTIYLLAARTAGESESQTRTVKSPEPETRRVPYPEGTLKITERK